MLYLITVTIWAVEYRNSPAFGKAWYIGHHVFNAGSKNYFLRSETFASISMYFKAVINFCAICCKSVEELHSAVLLYLMFCYDRNFAR